VRGSRGRPCRGPEVPGAVQGPGSRGRAGGDDRLAVLDQELQRVRAEVHLAEVVQTSGLKGRGKRPKTDWADARHLRELLLIGRLPESWIVPAHLLDLRARVRCLHTLVHQRTEWQQRMQSVLFHHGAPHSRGLLKLETANVSLR
jgi:hypothetical protein